MPWERARARQTQAADKSYKHIAGATRVSTALRPPGKFTRLVTRGSPAAQLPPGPQHPAPARGGSLSRSARPGLQKPASRLRPGQAPSEPSPQLRDWRAVSSVEASELTAAASSSVRRRSWARLVAWAALPGSVQPPASRAHARQHDVRQHTGPEHWWCGVAVNRSRPPTQMLVQEPEPVHGAGPRPLTAQRLACAPACVLYHGMELHRTR